MHYYITENHRASKIHQSERRAVQSGRARWLIERPRFAVDVRQPTEAPKRHVRRGFGEGVLRSLPTYRLPCTQEDAQWWAEESRREEDREVERRYSEYLAQERMSYGLHPY